MPASSSHVLTTRECLYNREPHSLLFRTSLLLLPIVSFNRLCETFTVIHGISRRAQLAERLIKARFFSLFLHGAQVRYSKTSISSQKQHHLFRQLQLTKHYRAGSATTQWLHHGYVLAKISSKLYIKTIRSARRRANTPRHTH